MIEFLGLDEPGHSVAVVVAVADVEVRILLATGAGELRPVLAVRHFHNLIRRVKVKIHKVFGDVELGGYERQLERRRVRLECERLIIKD